MRIKKEISLFLLLILISISCLSPKEKYESQGVKFNYSKYALTKMNPSDYSWKFLEEYNQEGYFVLISKRESLVISSRDGDELFKITKIKEVEGGYLASTSKNNIIFLMPDYNRIAIGRVDSDKFMSFILYDKDMEKFKEEVEKLVIKFSNQQI